MDSLRLALDLCREVSNQIDRIGNYTPEAGMDALAWSDQETASHQVVVDELVKIGARPIQDMAGNVTGLRKGLARQDVKGVMIGSHLDAVTNGGRYDGRAGVLVGLAVLKMLHEESKQLPHDVMVQMFRGEESSRFGKALLGSAMATGRSSLADFERASFIDGEDITLEQAMQGQGLNMLALKPKVESGQPLLPLSHIGWYVEPHIEQAGSLMEAGIPLGIATGIFGNMRANVRLLGETGHTGSTPMHLRHDANYGMIDIARNFQDLAEKIRQDRGINIRDTIPRYEVISPGNTHIPQDVRARFEVRTMDIAAMTEIQTALKADIEKAVAARGLRIHEGETAFNPLTMPTPNLSQPHIAFFEEQCTRLDIGAMKLPSGAGHDVQNMHEAGVDSTLLFIAHGVESSVDERGGFSHIPHEDMVVEAGADPYDLNGPFAAAVRATYEAVVHYEAPLKPEAGAEEGPILFN